MFFFQRIWLWHTFNMCTQPARWGKGDPTAFFLSQFNPRCNAKSTMGLSIALRISKNTKSKVPYFAQFWSEHSKLFGTGKNLPKYSGKNISVKHLSNIWYLSSKKHEGHDWKSWKFLQRLIRPFSSKHCKTTFLSVASFIVQISPNNFHSLEPKNHITSNLFLPPAC